MIIATAGLFSCLQGSQSRPEAEHPETVNSVRNYVYADSAGKRVLVHNSFPRGESYTDPKGTTYFKIIFWTRITNETDHPLDLRIAFPGDRYEVPGLPGKYFRVLVPPDTLRADKESMHNYGMTGLKSFLDSSLHKPSWLSRTIPPTDSSGFFVVILFDNGVGGPFRSSLQIKGQDLYYRISRFDNLPARLSMHEREIECGSINLKQLVLQQR